MRPTSSFTGMVVVVEKSKQVYSSLARMASSRSESSRDSMSVHEATERERMAMVVKTIIFEMKLDRVII
ncbi:MAG: hypothetical protein LIP09_07170 [Bacteroidales bacterium]|nr:hypothetical protein [Bacteroidales bacterium]